MSIKTITDNPTIADQIVFSIYTPDENGCFKIDPYKVSNVTISYIMRNYQTFGESTNTVDATNIILIAEYEQAKINLCNSDSSNYEENLTSFNIMEKKLNDTQLSVSSYYAEAKSVAIYGDVVRPAWIGTDIQNAFITHIPLDSHGNTQYGQFELEWTPLGMREGDYFITWSYNLYPAGNSLSITQYFSLGGATQLTTSIPTHQTVAGKYETLLERYRPDMFKMFMINGDLSPMVLQGLDNSVAAGFTVLEDMSNQMLDVIDSNATHESLLAPLANYFNIKLRSNDPTLWRRQIKQAVPLFKRKGTYLGLKEALAQAGIALIRFSRLWQVISKYTTQEAFVFNGSTDFLLSKNVVLPINPLNLELYYRSANASNWVDLTDTYSDYIDFSSLEILDPIPCSGQLTSPAKMIWLSTSPITLSPGDSIRIVYETKIVPNNDEQTLEAYTRSLCLSDDRDERLQDCPPKNWNVRLIADDDLYFNDIVTIRNPYYDPLIYGWIRTEFAYSENIFNMEEYNGSKRESNNPCDIDCDFIDPCSYGQSSKFDLDLDITELSHNRIVEAKEIITEYTPFHSMLNRLNVQGSNIDFVISPVEEIQGFINYKVEQVTLCGPQISMHRNMLDILQLRRTELADNNLVADGIGHGINPLVTLFSPLNDLYYAITNSINSLEILSIIPYSTYTLDRLLSHNRAVINSVPDSALITPANFTFRLSCDVMSFDPTVVVTDDVFIFNDPNVDLNIYSIYTIWNSEHPDSNLPPVHLGGSAIISMQSDPVAYVPWKIKIGTDSYNIIQTFPDGSLSLEGIGLSNANNLSYSLIDPNALSPIKTSDTGVIKVKKRGRVDVEGTILTDVRSIIFLDDTNYLRINNVEYKIIGFVHDKAYQFYIDEYDAGNLSQSSELVRRNLDMATGNFDYYGLLLDTSPVDYEQQLGILNGKNQSDLNPPTVGNLKENYLIKIGADYYAIEEIDGAKITLIGPKQNWTQAGISLFYEIYQYSFVGPITYPSTISPPIPGHTLDYTDRHKGEVIDSIEYNSNNEVVGLNVEMDLSTTLALSLKNKSQIEDVVGQYESITYIIEEKKYE